MRRHRDWDVRLVRWQSSVLGEAFRWGEADCASLVMGALEAMYPEDDVPLPEERPSYEGETAAARAHAATGGVAGVLEAHGASRAALAFTQSGDVLVGLDEQGGLPGAAVVVSGGFVVASETDGVTRRPLRALRSEDPDGIEVWRPPHE